MASPNISEIATTTIESRTKQLADDVSENNALLYRLNKRGRVKPFSGGRVIYQEMQYQENQTYTRYSGYQVINIAPSDVITSSEYEIKQAAVAVSISGLEELQNSGEERMIDLLESRIENAEITMRNNLSTDFYSDGSADGGKQIGGLQLLVADTPTSGIVGGINRATWTFWQNQSFDASTDGGTAATSSNIQNYMNTLYLRCSRGTDRPDLIVADNNYYKLYWESLQAIQRITSDNMGQAGFMSLKYMDADVVFDGGYGGAAPSNHMYMLNTRYLFWRPHRDRNMVPLNPDRFAVNQDAMVKLIAVAGNMTASNCFLQGVLKA